MHLPCCYEMGAFWAYWGALTSGWLFLSFLWWWLLTIPEADLKLPYQALFRSPRKEPQERAPGKKRALKNRTQLTAEILTEASAPWQACPPQKCWSNWKCISGWLGGHWAARGGEQQVPAVKDTFSCSGHLITPLFHSSDRWGRGPEAIIVGFCWCLWYT